MVIVTLAAEDQRSFTFIVLGVHICAERGRIDDKEFIACESCVVRRGLTAQIPRVDFKTFLHEVEHGDRLVALRTNMHHIDTALVLSADVGAMLDEEADQVQVAVETREVKSRE